MIVTSFREALLKTLYVDSTRPLRLTMAMVEIFFVVYMLGTHSDDFDVMYRVFTELMWAFLFLGHAALLLRGLTGVYSTFTRFAEGLGGVGLWFVTAVTSWAGQGVPGPTMACFLVMVIIWVNYPDNRKSSEGQSNG